VLVPRSSSSSTLPRPLLPSRGHSTKHAI
jgi:hypothetical protein